MAKKLYDRTPEAAYVTVQDDDLKVGNILELPVITTDNEEDQRLNCVGVKGGIPMYHNGTEMVPFAAGAKPYIPTTGDFTITWQTDIVPGQMKTYAQIYGNHIFDVKAIWNDGGTIRPYTPDWSYTKMGSNINVFTLNAVFEGELTFI